ncbi:MAG TPA: LPD23 domain-containing protein [Xanthomonadales bacterium]|nr:LPD23 domain-containing protein [Xanthomonadales bacterium]
MDDPAWTATAQAHVARVRGAIAALIGADSSGLPEGIGQFVVTTSEAAAAAGLTANASAPRANTLASLSRDAAFDAMLLQRRERLRAAVEAIGQFDDGAIVRHRDYEDRWKIICRDASNPGHWRTQSFDLKGFSGHLSFATREQAIEDAASSGFTVRDDAALDRIQDTPAFQRGLFAAELIRKVNVGELSFLAANEELAEYDRLEQVLGSIGAVTAQAYYEPQSNTMVFLADRIASGHEEAVFLHEVVHKHGRATLGRPRWNRLVEQVLQWARAPLGALERSIHDAAFVRAIGAVGPGATEPLREEMLAYAVEEAVRRGVVPSARSELGSAANWLAQVTATLRNLVRRLSGAKAAEAIGVQDMVDLAYALAQLEHPDRARQIQRELGPELTTRLQREIGRLASAEEARRRVALAQSLAQAEAVVVRAVADLASSGDAADHEREVFEARAQCAKVAAQHLGRDTWLRSPNGEPTRLTTAQWVMVRTENFKRWFGDWEFEPSAASYALDPVTREPRVLYHGALKGGFAEFDPGKARSATDAMFFSSDPCVAGTYSGSLDEVDVCDPDEFGDFETRRGIYPVFLNIRNPQFEHFEGAAWNGERHDQWRLLDEYEEPLEVDGLAVFDRAQAERLEREHPHLELVPADDHWCSTNDVANDARRNKCDGAILYDVIDEGKFGGGYSDPSDVYVVFSGRQVKSATLNVGTFDDGWDIRYSERASTPGAGPDSRIRYSFAGEKAQSADRLSLDAARKRLDGGDDAELVRKDTGWSRGVDGKWRFEISDAQAHLRMQDLSWGEVEDLKRGNSTGLPLGRLLDHPALFSAYPALQDVWVRLIPGMKGAAFVLSENTMKIGYDRQSGSADLSGLLHEIQHSVQHIEGFASGGTPETAALPQIRQINETLSWIAKEKDSIQEMRHAPGVDPRRVSTQLRALDDFYREKLNERANIDGFATYRRLAGEVEARNTQARQALTEAERREIAPRSTADVPESELIVAFGPQASVDACTVALENERETGADPLKALQALIEEADGNIHEVDLRARVECLARSVEVFAAEHAVYAALRPWDPMGSVTGVELTDLYANEPGAGQGTLVVRHLTGLAQDLGVVVYLRADGPRSREFYARAGFVPVPSRSRGGAGGFLAWFPPVQKEDEYEDCPVRERVGG